MYREKKKVCVTPVPVSLRTYIPIQVVHRNKIITLHPVCRVVKSSAIYKLWKDCMCRFMIL
jgi:hypothetical protein